MRPSFAIIDQLQPPLLPPQKRLSFFRPGHIGLRVADDVNHVFFPLKPQRGTGTCRLPWKKLRHPIPNTRVPCRQLQNIPDKSSRNITNLGVVAFFFPDYPKRTAKPRSGWTLSLSLSLSLD